MSARPLPFYRNPFIWFAGIMVVVATAAAIMLRPKPVEELPVLATLGEFTLTTQDKKPYGLQDLRGKVTLANFIFTSCPDVCPLLTKQMAKAQARAASLKIPVNFVSVSVDPSNDTPEVLKEYALKNHVDFSNWTFLTGPLDAIEKIILDGFKVALDRKGEDTDIFDITHTEHFVILDQAGQIRAYRKATNTQEIDEILMEIKHLQTSVGLTPSVR